MEFSHEIDIQRPAEAVFARLVDWDSHPEWIEGLVTSRATGGDGVGQRFAQTLERGPLRIELDGQVVEHSAPRSLGFEASAKDVRLTVRVELDASDATTRLRQHTAVTLESFVLKMMASKVKDELQSKQATDLERLKQLLEADAG
ncbi:MAG: SRPBCC family protein [Planctomycetota bacterium]